MKHQPKKLVSTEDDHLKLFALIMMYLSGESLDAVKKEPSQSKLEVEVEECVRWWNKTIRYTHIVKSKKFQNLLQQPTIKWYVKEAMSQLLPTKKDSIEDFICIEPDEINYDRNYDSFHTTINLKIKYIDKTMIDKF